MTDGEMGTMAVEFNCLGETPPYTLEVVFKFNDGPKQRLTFEDYQELQMAASALYNYYLKNAIGIDVEEIASAFAQIEGMGETRQ